MGRLRTLPGALAAAAILSLSTNASVLLGSSLGGVLAVAPGPWLVYALDAAGFAVSFVLVWLLKQRREPDFSRWSLAFPLLVLFLLSNKVYSPQYGLWLLPFFALGGSDLKTFVAFEVADVAVFVTRFSFFGDLSGYGGLPFGAFEIAIAARALILIWAVVAWVRRPCLGRRILPGLDVPLEHRPVDRAPYRSPVEHQLHRIHLRPGLVELGPGHRQVLRPRPRLGQRQV